MNFQNLHHLPGVGPDAATGAALIGFGVRLISVGVGKSAADVWLGSNKTPAATKGRRK